MKTKSTLLFCIICCLVVTNMFKASAQSFSFTSSASSVEFTVEGEGKVCQIDWGNGIPVTTTLKKATLCSSTPDYTPGVPVTVSYDASKPIFYLEISGQELTELNVSSSGANLKELYCSSNELKTLDLSKNNKLKELNCSSNELDSLDISKNIELKGLYCSKNKIKALDVSLNSHLQNLNCSMNKLCFATLPLPNMTLATSTLETPLDDLNAAKKSYSYAPQQNLKVYPVGLTVDLSAQQSRTYADATNTITYTWYTNEDKELLTKEYNEENGVFTFNSYHADSIYCTISNTAFPGFMGEDILRTESFKLDATTGVENSELTTSISCYPNPMVDMLHIKTADNEIAMVKIYNINGVLALQAKGNDIDVSKLSQGIYIVEVNGQKIKVIKK